jgi:hypothetical protein
VAAAGVVGYVAIQCSVRVGRKVDGDLEFMRVIESAGIGREESGFGHYASKKVEGALGSVVAAVFIEHSVYGVGVVRGVKASLAKGVRKLRHS